MPNPLKNATRVAERIRALAERLEVEHDGQTITFTVSLGLAQFEQSLSSPMGWLEQADQALYRAKESGRNQHCVHEVGSEYA